MQLGSSLLVWATLLGGLIQTLTPAFADIQIKRLQRGNAPSLDITISGSIQNLDLQELQAITNIDKMLVTVFLNSEGGGVFPAMEIGRILRANDATTLIQGKCFSSCALVFIAGVKRIIADKGQLGLHRPYLAADPKSRQIIEKQVPQMLSAVKSYTTEMRLTDEFYQQMVNTEPSRMIVYNSRNYTKLLPETDPVYEEVVIAEQARKYGTTTLEVRKREGDTTACFQDSKNRDLQEMMDCYQATKWGLTIRVWKDRLERSFLCVLSDQEHVEFWRTPRRLRRDLPFVIRQETCVRNAILGP